MEPAHPSGHSRQEVSELAVRRRAPLGADLEADGTGDQDAHDSVNKDVASEGNRPDLVANRIRAMFPSCSPTTVGTRLQRQLTACEQHPAPRVVFRWFLDQLNGSHIAASVLGEVPDE